MSLTRRGFLAALAILPACAGIALAPTTARADLESDLAAAEQRLVELGERLAELQSDLEKAGEDLERTDNEIGDIEIKIADTEAELASLRELLAERMRSGYKAGYVNLLDFLLGAGSIEEFESRIYYMDKVTESDAAAISRVKELEFELEQHKAELETKRTEQQARVEEVEAQVEEYEEAVAEAQAYYDQLDQELKEELARRAEEERRAAEAAAAAARESELAAQQQPSLVTVIDVVQPTTPTYEPQPEPEQPSDPGTTTEEPTPTVTVDPTPTTTYRPAAGGGVATAIEIANMGNVPYIYGADGNQATFAFDCSGLVYYCYVGYRCGTAGTIGRAIQARGTWVEDLSLLNYGDCVFTRPSFDHIGIYLGGGTMVHAPSPGRCVCYGTVNESNFYGGGPFAT